MHVRDSVRIVTTRILEHHDAVRFCAELGRTVMRRERSFDIARKTITRASREIFFHHLAILVEVAVSDVDQAAVRVCILFKKKAE